MKLKDANIALRSAAEAVHAAAKAIEDAPEGADEAALKALDAALEDASAEHARCLANVERAKRTAAGLAVEVPEVEKAEEIRKVEVVEKATEVEKRGAIGAVSLGKDNETVYRADKSTSFFRDMYLMSGVDGEASRASAIDRLQRHRTETLAILAEKRDMTGASTQGGDFLPPIYLADKARNVLTAGRPFANVLPKGNLPEYGTAITIPNLASGLSVATRAGGGSVSETDGVTATISSAITEIAGQIDIERIAIMRSFPGFDTWAYNGLVKRYNAHLDLQLLEGTGTAPQLRGIRAVSGVNTVAYTDGTPTQAELLPKLYDAAQKVASNRLDGMQADMLVAHPRRLAWLAAGLSSTFPLFGQGNAVQTVGNQDKGAVIGALGFEHIVSDANIGVLRGAGTNEDEMYVLHSSDLELMEGPLNSRVFEDVGSGTGTVRLQIFAHVGFLANIFPESITVISGTGLVTPAF